MLLIGQVSSLVKNFNFGIFLDTKRVINVKVCMMVLLVEGCLFMPLSVNLTIIQGKSSVYQF